MAFSLPQSDLNCQRQPSGAPSYLGCPGSLLLQVKGTQTTLLLNPSRPYRPRGDASTREVTVNDHDSSLERDFPLA